MTVTVPVPALKLNRELDAILALSLTDRLGAMRRLLDLVAGLDFANLQALLNLLIEGLKAVGVLDGTAKPTDSALASHVAAVLPPEKFTAIMDALLAIINLILALMGKPPLTMATVLSEGPAIVASPDLAQPSPTRWHK
jgi:hypothetical protein